MAISNPAESICNFSVPGCIVFPGNFPHIFDSIEREVNSKGNFVDLGRLTFEIVRLLPLHGISIERGCSL
jgi:hypothetical protein